MDNFKLNLGEMLEPFLKTDLSNITDDGNTSVMSIVNTKFKVTSTDPGAGAPSDNDVITLVYEA